MAMFAEIDKTTKVLKLTREEAVKVIDGLVRQLGEIGPMGLPEVNTGAGYRLAFVVESK